MKKVLPSRVDLREGDTNGDVIVVKQLLARFGYYDGRAKSPFFHDTLRRAVEHYQTFHHLTRTGVVDAPTLATMRQPRCACPDVGPGASARFATADVATFTTFGQKWNKRRLVYRVAPAPLPPGLTLAAVQSAMASAFALWSQPTGLEFVAAGAGVEVDIEIVFAAGDHGDGFPFDGVGNVLAHAFFPPPNGGSLAGDAHFDLAERWTVTLPPSAGAFDLVTVAGHEFGHSLGLGHSDVTDALMFPTYTGPHRRLAADDVAGIQSLYSTGGVTLAASGLYPVDATFTLLVGPRDDLYAVKFARTGSRKVEVHVLTAISQYQTFSRHIATALPEVDATFDFALAPNGDLLAIKRSATGTRRTEIHMLTAASNYQRFGLQIGTALHETDANYAFGVTPARDLVVVKRRGVQSSEVHVLAAASNYQSFAIHAATPVPISGLETAFAVAPTTGDVIAIRRGTQTEVTVLAAASRYTTVALRTTLSLATDAAFDFGATQARDLLVIRRTGGATTEIGKVDL